MDDVSKHLYNLFVTEDGLTKRSENISIVSKNCNLTRFFNNWFPQQYSLSPKLITYSLKHYINILFPPLPVYTK